MKILKLPVRTGMICDYCGCEFEFDTDDLEVTEAWSDDRVERIVSVYCPFCRKEHILLKPSVR